MARGTAQFCRSTLTVLVAVALQQVSAADTQLETVKVSAEAQAEAPVVPKNPATVFALSRKEIERYNETTVGALLRKLPNVTFSGPPGMVEDIRVLGLDKGYTEFLIDGERVPGGSKDRQLQLSRLSVDMIERIELIQVPSADMSGAGIGGTINIVLRKDRNPGGWYSLGVGKAGSETPLRGSIGQTFSGEGFSLSLAASANQRNELKDKTKNELTIASGARALEDEHEVRDINDYSFSPSLSWALADGMSLTVDGLFNRSEEDKSKTVAKTAVTAAGVASANGSKVESEQKDRDIARLSVALKGEFANDGKWQLRATGQETSEDKDKWAIDYAKNGTATRSTELSSINDRDMGLSGSVERRFGEHLPSLGFALNDSKLKIGKSATSNGVLAAAKAKENASLSEDKQAFWLQDRWLLAAGHELTAGLRHERVEQNNDAKTGNYEFNRPSLQYTWQFAPATKLRAAAAEAVRLPKLEQLANYTEGSGTSASPYVTGNANLRPELSKNYELALDHQLGDKGSVGLNWSQRDITDLIENRTTEESGVWYKRAYNVGDAEAEAITLQGRYDFGFVELGAAYSKLDSSVKDSTTGKMRQMKGQPKYTWKLDAARKFPAGWSAGLTYTHLGQIANGGDEDEEATESAQKLLDVYIAKTISKQLTVRLAGANLLDTTKQKYKTSTTKLTSELEDGRPSYWLTLEGKW